MILFQAKISKFLQPNIKVVIASSESKPIVLSQRICVNHPEYQAAKEELDKLKSMHKQETQNVSSSDSGTTIIYKQRDAELKAASVRQNTPVLELNLSRGVRGCDDLSESLKVPVFNISSPLNNSTKNLIENVPLIA